MLKSILLAEDNPQDTELAIEALMLHNLAINVVVVRDGVEAMEYLNYEGQFENRKKGDPAVLLLDIKMSRMNGIELLEAIRRNEKFKSLPIVMLTSSREEQDLKKCYDLDLHIMLNLLKMQLI